MDALKRESARLRDRAAQVILKATNRIANLSTDKDDARHETLAWEHSFAQVQGSATDRTLLLGRVKMCVELVSGHCDGICHR